jgi:hypothetical protein
MNNYIYNFFQLPEKNKNIYDCEKKTPQKNYVDYSKTNNVIRKRRSHINPLKRIMCSLVVRRGSTRSKQSEKNLYVTAFVRSPIHHLNIQKVNSSPSEWSFWGDVYGFCLAGHGRGGI